MMNESLMNESLMFSSTTDKWETPQDFFDELNREFGFSLDVCALPENAKTTRYYTPEQDGPTLPWECVVWCNPPYGRQIGKWVERAALAAKSGVVVVMLLPARTERSSTLRRWCMGCGLKISTGEKGVLLLALRGEDGRR